MTGWLALGLFGGLVGLDSTSFPQAMISRPVVAGTLTGALFGRPVEGLVIGFIMESFSLITLPIGAARYPESGTATVAAVGAYVAAMAPGLAPGPLLIATVFGLGWEWVAGETVVLHRRSSGRMLTGHGTLAAEQLKRAHLAAMAMDFVRAAVVVATGALIGYALLELLAGQWGLPQEITLGFATLLVATMMGTTIALFGGARERRLSWALGLLTGVALMVAL